MYGSDVRVCGPVSSSMDRVWTTKESYKSNRKQEMVVFWKGFHMPLRSWSSTIIAFLSLTGTSEDWVLVEVGHERRLSREERGNCQTAESVLLSSTLPSVTEKPSLSRTFYLFTSDNTEAGACVSQIATSLSTVVVGTWGVLARSIKWQGDWGLRLGDSMVSVGRMQWLQQETEVLSFLDGKPPSLLISLSTYLCCTSL